jgi:hypothetical protein
MHPSDVLGAGNAPNGCVVLPKKERLFAGMSFVLIGEERCRTTLHARCVCATCNHKRESHNAPLLRACAYRTRRGAPVWSTRWGFSRRVRLQVRAYLGSTTRTLRQVAARFPHPPPRGRRRSRSSALRCGAVGRRVGRSRTRARLSSGESLCVGARECAEAQRRRLPAGAACRHARCQAGVGV